MSVGFLALARQTFDVPYAAAIAHSALQTLDEVTASQVVGEATLAMETDEVSARAGELASAHVSAVVIFQATFSDSTLVRVAAGALEGRPLVLWAVPEARTGGRLRLNSLCGINLAAYVLARDEVDYRWLYRSPEDPAAPAELLRAIDGEPRGRAQKMSPKMPKTGRNVPNLRGKTIGLVGDRPNGFEPCDFDPGELTTRFGVGVDRVELTDLFAESEAGHESSVETLKTNLADTMVGVDTVDQESLERSLRLYLGLSSLAEERNWAGVATRCWPECFTEFGGAACIGNSLLTSQGIPGCCEADVYGDLTALLLQEVAELPPFVADLVDIDRETNTATFWHCGLAPRELAPDGVRPVATVHSNRKKPLLNEFPLRPGDVTIMRLSQSQNEHRMFIATGEILDTPLPFSGTSGVARLNGDVDIALDTVMANGLEHHYGIAYGDHRDGLYAYAADLGLGVIEL